MQDDEVGHVVFGNVIQTELRDMYLAYLARVTALDGSVSQHAPALTVNRLCGLGLQAIVSASQSTFCSAMRTSPSAAARRT